MCPGLQGRPRPYREGALCGLGRALPLPRSTRFSLTCCRAGAAERHTASRRLKGPKCGVCVYVIYLWYVYLCCVYCMCSLCGAWCHVCVCGVQYVWGVCGLTWVACMCGVCAVSVGCVQGVCVRHSVCDPEPTRSKCRASGPLGGLHTEQNRNSTLLWMA